MVVHGFQGLGSKEEKALFFFSSWRGGGLFSGFFFCGRCGSFGLVLLPACPWMSAHFFLKPLMSFGVAQVLGLPDVEGVATAGLGGKSW